MDGASFSLWFSFLMSIYNRFIRCGAAQGADFTLYKDSPSRIHASFAVLVRPSGNISCNFNSGKRRKSSISWRSVQCLSRISYGLGKSVVLCEVHDCKGVFEECLSEVYLSKSEVGKEGERDIEKKGQGEGVAECGKSESEFCSEKNKSLVTSTASSSNCSRGCLSIGWIGAEETGKANAVVCAVLRREVLSDN